MKIIIIFIVGGLATLSRYLLLTYMGKKHFINVPLNTLIINLIGCFLFGITFEWLRKYYEANHFLYLILFTAFFGSFTTFSAFVLEGFLILKKNAYLWALSYFIVTLLLSLVAFFMGTKIVNVFLK